MFELDSVDLPTLYNELNAEFFEGHLPPCRVSWSRRLRRAAGLIYVEKAEISLSVPLLVEAWGENSKFEVCGIWCDSPQWALREILKHEMIHLWLYVNKLPHGHTPAFRAKARQIGQSKSRHSIQLPHPKSGWVYSCARVWNLIPSSTALWAARRVCQCCKAYSGGQFDARFVLRGTKKLAARL